MFRIGLAEPRDKGAMTRFLSQFAIVTALPAGMLFAVVSGGWIWAAAAFVYLTVVAHIADQVIGDISENPDEDSLKTVLPLAISFVHFALLATGVLLMRSEHLGIGAKLLVILAYGQFFTVVSNAVAHELIHRSSRLERVVGKWMFISHLFGHHVSAHLLVHHPFVGTDKDPNSARVNETFSRFLKRSWRGSFSEGLRAESNRRRGTDPGSRSIVHPYLEYAGGAVFFLFLSGFIGGIPGMFGYVAMAVLAQTGLLLTDYVQHYGLRRSTDPSGKTEPVSPQHSWNSPKWFTRHLSLNATRHSEHHTRPAAAYTELRDLPPDIAPELPYPSGVMAYIALFPRFWRPLMNPRVAALQFESSEK